MRKLITAAATAATLATALVGAAAPADAQRWGGRGYYGGYHHHGVGAGTAVAAGILGLGVGAAIAADRRPYYGRGYYGGGYYGGGYYDAPAYYAPPPPPAYAYAPACHSEWRWDGWRGRYEPVRYCD